MTRTQYNLYCLGLYFSYKYRSRIKDSDIQSVARQLRKQGIPLNVARFILL